MEATNSMQKTVKTKMNVLDHIFIIVVRSQWSNCHFISLCWWLTCVLCAKWFNLCKTSQINVCVLMSQDIEHYWRISKQRPTLYLPPSYFRKSTPLAPPPPLLISLHHHTSPRLILPSLPIPTSLFTSNNPVPCLPFLRMENGAYLRHFWFSFSELKGLSKWKYYNQQFYAS